MQGTTIALELPQGTGLRVLVNTCVKTELTF